MLGARSGLATRLKELNPTLISVHCICHKLALACADTSKDLDYIAGVERDLRTLWKAMENSPKRTNMYLSVQEELKSLRLQDQSKKIVARRLKKACHTRWLSMGQAVDTVYRDLEAVLRTLQSLEKEDTVACGLLTKMHKPKFIGCIYIFQHVLPILNQLSKTFQKGSVNFSHIGPAVEHAKQKLQTISSDALPVKQLQEDFKPGGRLSRIDLAPTEYHFVEMDRLLKKYVTSLITNIDDRFKASIPVSKAFSIFDVMAIPSIRSQGLRSMEMITLSRYQSISLPKGKRKRMTRLTSTLKSSKQNGESSSLIWLTGKMNFQETSRKERLQPLPPPGLLTVWHASPHSVTSFPCFSP